MEMFIEGINYEEHKKKYTVEFHDTLFCIPLVLMGHTSGIREFFKDYKDDTIARNVIYIKELIAKCGNEVINMGDYISSTSELYVLMDKRTDLDSISLGHFNVSELIKALRIRRKYRDGKQYAGDFRINGIDMEFNNSEIALICGCCMFNYHFNKKRTELKQMQNNEIQKQKLFETFRS